jgi:hypothetical protein
MPREPHALERSGGSANLADVLERVLDKGIVIAGDIKLFLGQVELLTLQIRLVVCSIDKAKEMGLDWWTNHPAFSPHRRVEPSAEVPAPAVPRTTPH